MKGEKGRQVDGRAKAKERGKVKEGGKTRSG
jgi:hypothetical protein